MQASIPGVLRDRNTSMFAVESAESPDADKSMKRIFSAFIGNHRMIPITS